MPSTTFEDRSADQRPALERAAEQIGDAQQAAARVNARLTALVARGELSRKSLETLNEPLRQLDDMLGRALWSIGEAAP